MRRCAAALALIAGLVQAQVDTPVPPEFFGLHMNMGAARRAEYGWPAIEFGSWRLIHPSTTWAGLEPARGQWRWEALDRAVADAQAHGVEPLLTLGFTPDWAARRKAFAPTPHEGHAAFAPRELDDWRRYVSAVAQRYRGRIRWYELWNEPHFSETDRIDYGFGVDDMVQLARVAREALRAVDPANRLVSFSPPGAQRGIRRLELFFERGGGAFVDAVGFHFYTTPPAPEAIATLTAQLRAVMRAHGLARLPIWNTEAGYMTEDAEHGIAPGPVNRHGDRWLRLDEAAAYTARSLIVARDAGLARWYGYAWAVRGYQLSRDAGRAASPAGEAWATTRRWLLGRRLQPCTRPAPALWRCTLVRPEDGATAELVWRSDDRPQAVDAGAAGWVETLQGETLPVGPGRQVSIGAAPLLLKRTPQPWR